ncbi:hypothetical protein IQ235_18470 [Oscillatoriales cyanobacterium LEGE 11467]|uniref:Uncharacterized protein n=1 Tax=Zarconia navalis LEGE 11467 TaxID=1828826 RepID=A0A928W2I5_9CYAN|nr:hypothetical protein [Zarconia navalis]MBE9042748.1 hypothetical protein [Zarconia navalis LEGE 11467]
MNLKLQNIYSVRSFNGGNTSLVSFSTYQTPSRLTNTTHTVMVSANEAIENIDFGNISLLEPVIEDD